MTAKVTTAGRQTPATARTTRRLTPKEWETLAGLQCDIERLMYECDGILRGTLSDGSMLPYRHAWGAVQGLRYRLDNLAYQQGQRGDGLFSGPGWTYHTKWLTEGTP